ncbi:hypothetical protein [Enterococcus gallinarum]|uniref:hypothetical protein n=1 Tax=Enterococcus gallinarum TaxID=1353 RepID=UPI0018A8B910|nr:hypothetical protein [Enterococcus gallinarum]
MEFVYLGPEIKLSEYLYRYEEMIRYILQESSFANLSSDRSKALLKAELCKAETEWYEFYYLNRRGPDYSFFQDKVTDFGVNRLALFDHRDEKLTKDNFVHSHIESLKSEKLLSLLQFEETDYAFIEEYERKRASQYFTERNEYLKGYEGDRISTNETMQRIGYQQLRESFLIDPLIDSYKRKN